MKENLLISACLLGIPCRYDGKSVCKIDIDGLRDRYNLIPVCPEIYGGLPTPRTPSERVFDEVLMKDGTCVSENYKRGAEATLTIARVNNVKVALLKERSPSCGKGAVYDGTFSGTLTEGNGVAVDLLLANEIKVYGESEISKLLK